MQRRLLDLAESKTGELKALRASVSRLTVLCCAAM
jgi:hypothetical protein